MKKSGIILLALGILLPVSLIITSGIGAADIHSSTVAKVLFSRLGIGNFEGLSSSHDAIIWNIRFPRVLMTMLVGGALALSGAAMQGLFRNPLADPSIIGVTSCAALTTAIVIVLLNPFLEPWQEFAGIGPISIASFIGAVLASYLIFAIGREKKRTHVATMLLGGIALNALAGAGIGLLVYLADDTELRTLTFWTLGSMGSAQWKQVLWMLIAVILSIALIFPFSKSFNALSLGEKQASHLGVNVESLKTRIILSTGLSVGVSVAFCGIIGFVGLVVPHILRLLGESRHQFLLPASFLGGGLLLTWADALARTIVSPAELPIGILTSLIGSPIFMYLLLKEKRSAA